MIHAIFMYICQVYLDITHEDPEERWPKKYIMDKIIALNFPTLAVINQT